MPRREHVSTTPFGAWHDFILRNQAGGSADDFVELRNGLTFWNGADPNQTWYLVAQDLASPDIGYIDYFQIVVNYSTPSVPASPTGLTAVGTASSIGLAWTDNANSEQGFNIERKVGAGGTFAYYATVGANVTSYTDTGVVAWNTYYYKVYAYNAAGASQYYSNEASATLQEAQSLTVGTPNGGQDWVAGTTHSINWSVSGSTANVWYYKVALCTDGGATWPATGTANDLTPDGIVDPNARSFSWTISSSLNTTQARIRVRAIDFDRFIINTLSDMSDADFTISSSATPDIRISPTTLTYNSTSTKTPIYIEIDWMEDGTHSQKPSQAVINRITQTFAKDGFDIHIALSGAIPYQSVLAVVNNVSSSPAVQAIRD